MVSQKGKCVCAWKKQKDGIWKPIPDIWNTDSKLEAISAAPEVAHMRFLATGFDAAPFVNGRRDASE